MGEEEAATKILSCHNIFDGGVSDGLASLAEKEKHEEEDFSGNCI